LFFFEIKKKKPQIKKFENFKKNKKTMANFHFFQFERELFWRYFKRLNVFLAQGGYCGKF